MSSITLTNNVAVTIVIDGQDKAQLMWTLIDYALNQMPAGSISSDDTTLMNSIRTQLASVFD